jgi:predicted nucleic acid-binding protein
VNAYVTDTHALLWYLTADGQLSATCRDIFEAADRGEVKVWIPGISIVETIYLVERARFPAVLVTQMLDLVDPPTAGYGVALLDAGVIRSLATVDRSTVPDMPDRGASRQGRGASRQDRGASRQGRGASKQGRDA